MQNWDFFGTKFGLWSHLGPSPKFGTSLERLDRTKCKPCFGCPRMVPEKTSLFKLGVWFGVTHKVKVKLIFSLNSIYNLSKVLS